VLTGGTDVSPSLYQELPHEQTDAPDRRRDRFELALVRAAIDAGLPLLAIGRGLQVLNVARGGTLIQYLPEAVGHSGHAPGTAKMAQHDVTVKDGSALGKLLGSKTQVPSLHHQAIKQAGDGLVTVAWADDQVIEAVEVEGHRFAIGVQWHPEEGDDLRLLQALVKAAATPVATPAVNGGRKSRGRVGARR
jgi:putative glutamine amidotransferase